jgi:hypothetical protein
MNILEWEESLSYHSRKTIEQRLKFVLEQIKFLENIYMTGGEYNHFSKEFSNAALKERQELCQLSSACYHILGGPAYTSNPCLYSPVDE